MVLTEEERKERKERRKEATKKYNTKNKEKVKETNKQYYQKNKEKCKEYYLKHKEEIKEYQKEYNQTPKRIKTYKISNWKRYGVIHDDFDKLYEHYINTNECNVCKVIFTDNNWKCLDHDHETVFLDMCYVIIVIVMIGGKIRFKHRSKLK